MRLLFIGDVVGRPGRDIIRKKLSELIDSQRLDLVIANAENAAGGSGFTPAIYKELSRAGVDGFTLGDHVYRRREIYPLLDNEDNIVRPANLPTEAVGREWAVATARDGTRVGFCCLLGQLFMKSADNPWRVADRVLAAMPSDVCVRMVDFHVEATSEAQLLGRYLDGRVAAVLGTHTHVPTADECVLPGGTAFQCDVGMTGPYESILGRRIDRVLQSKLTGMPTQFDVADGDARLCGSIVEIDSETGKAASIVRVCVRESDGAAANSSSETC
ncbi:MAG: TIGR00282 family metallophosphoesterase [Planctomycetota bacterium]